MINYYLLTKPGIIMGNLFTVTAGFLLASHGLFDFKLFVYTVLGLTLVIASACVFNNYIDRDLDKKMSRTKGRPLAKGLISGKRAILFAALLGVLGGLTLYKGANLLTFLVATVGFFVYVILYSLWKSRTLYATAIGSIAGATPPVVGYSAASGHLDLGAYILFALLIFWQMPHFFSIALYRLEDYSNAKIPVLPIARGIYRTKLHMTFYIVAFIGATALLTLFAYTGYIFLSVGALLGICWLVLCLKGFRAANDLLWAKKMFRLSLLVITALCIVIVLDSF